MILQIDNQTFNLKLVSRTQRVCSAFDEKMIRDQAFGMVRDDYQRRDKGKVVGVLEGSNRGVHPDEIEKEVTLAYELYESCYGYGDRCRDQSLTDQEAIDEMKKNFPGFEEKTYRGALAYGYQISR